MHELGSGSLAASFYIELCDVYTHQLLHEAFGLLGSLLLRAGA
jgi:hypothetical protein